MSEKSIVPTDAQELRTRLQSVNVELQRIGATVRKDADSLERLRQMLDVSYVGELITLIEEMERQVSAATESAAQAAEETDEYRRRLGAEEERLEKLWDAYKVQEREFLSVKETVTRLERDLADKGAAYSKSETLLLESDRNLRTSEEDNGRLRASMVELKANVSRLEKELADRGAAFAESENLLLDRDRSLRAAQGDNEKLRASIVTFKETVIRLERDLADKTTAFAESEAILSDTERDLRTAEDENERLRARIVELEARSEELQHVATLRSRVDDLEAKYAAEKERLAKLYTVYEELEGERDNYRLKVEEWERWFKQAFPHFEQSYRAVRRRAATETRDPPPAID